MPDPYGTPGSYRAPGPYRSPDSYRSSEPDPPSGSYRVPGYYRDAEAASAGPTYQAPEAQQAAEAFPVTGSGSYGDDSYTGDDPYGDDSYTGQDEPASYETPDDYEPADPYEPLSSWDAPEPEPEPEPYEAPESYEAPAEPVTAAADGADDYGALGRYGETPGQPDQGRKGPTGEEDYTDFWREERRGGGLHSSRSSQPKTSTAGSGLRTSGPSGPPSLPGDVRGSRQPASVRRQVGFLVAVLAIIVAAGATAAIFLLSHHGKKQPAAGGAPSSAATTHHPTTSPPATSSGPPPPPALTAASGHLGVPRSIGSLQLNPALTDKFVGSPEKKQVANSFFIPDSDVISGFYTTDPSATSFTTKDPRLDFLVAYLAGSGKAQSWLHGFMTDASLSHQQQISPGGMGGVAACGELSQKAGPVAHCMWADGNTYADFYAWDSSPSALAQTMIAIRSQVELKH